MTVYVDVLLCINLIVDYFIISLTAKLLKTSCRFGRQLLGSAVGGICALFILLPEGGIILNLLLRLLTAAAVITASFGFGSVSLFLRKVCAFFAISFVFSGAMFAVWYFIRPAGLLVHNGIVYYNLSSIVLIVSAIFVYCLITLISRFIARKTLQTCRLKIETDSSTVEVIALVDSGNKLKEPFSERPVVLIDPKYSFILEGAKNKERVIPYSTVSDSGILLGVRPKAVYLLAGEAWESLDVYLAASPNSLKEYSAIIGSDAL